MAQGRKRNREISNLDDQIGGQEPDFSSSSAKRARENRIRVPFSCATELFELTKELGFKRDGMTVEWLIQQSELDQDPYQFSSADEPLINTQKDMTKNTPRGRPPSTKDRHRLTEDGRDRRIRVPNKCISQIIQLTEKLHLKSDGETIEWLFRKYRLSGIRPQQATQSTTAPISTSIITYTSFNGAYLSPENDSSIFPKDFSIPGRDNQQDLAGHYGQENFIDPAFHGNPKARQYGIASPSHPYNIYLPPSSTVGTANQFQFTSYPQQQIAMPNAGGGMTANDGLNMDGSRSTSERPRQMGSLPYDPYFYPEQKYVSSSAMAGERLVGSAENLSYTEQAWQPYSTSSTSIPQPYCPPNQYSLPYVGINRNSNAISMNSAYQAQQQPWYPGVGGNCLRDPINPYDNRYSNGY